MLELMPKEVSDIAGHVAYAAAKFTDVENRYDLMGVYVVIDEGQIKAYAADGYRAASYATSYEVEAPDGFNGFSDENTFKVFMPLHGKAEEKQKLYNAINDLITKGDVVRKCWYTIVGLKESVKESATGLVKLLDLWINCSFIEDFYNNIPIGEDDLSPVFLEVVNNDHPDMQEHLRLQCGLYECVIMPIKLEAEENGES